VLTPLAGTPCGDLKLRPLHMRWTPLNEQDLFVCDTASSLDVAPSCIFADRDARTNSRAPTRHLVAPDVVDL